ncbi:hypothetical protein [Sorangium sp. So ce1153]|uniref:hypothetical protein n=1 Tax=Sorangium sp. So ce1153 TaxID=3133333 RepID=UPI003F619D55
MRKDFGAINEQNMEAVMTWLNDRNQFHTWLTSLITGSFVVLTAFGSKPGFSDIGQTILSTALVLLLISVLCSLVCVWSIPTWKFRVNTKLITDAASMTRELAITAWIGVICFVAGLTLGFIGNVPW